MPSLGDMNVVHGCGTFQVCRRGRRVIQAFDSGPVMADRAPLKASTAEPDRLDRCPRYPDRRKQVAGAATNRSLKALEHVE